MPEAGHEKRHHRCYVVIPPFAVLLINGAENIIAQESGQCHMPPSPVILEISCLVRGIKVVRNHDVEHHSKSDRHVRVTGKVKVIRNGILNRVIPRTDHRQIVVNISKKRLCIGRQRICQQNFFCAADRKEKQTGRHMLRIQL